MKRHTPIWRPDPTGRYELRYWSGRFWTEYVATAGEKSIDVNWPDMREPNTRSTWIKHGDWVDWGWPENAIRGESYRQNTIKRLPGVTKIADGVRCDPVVVEFVREPTNPVDASACIANVAGQQVGYLAAEYAAEVAQIVDAAGIRAWRVAGAVVGGTEGATSFGVHVWLGQRLTIGPRPPTTRLPPQEAGQVGHAPAAG